MATLRIGKREVQRVFLARLPISNPPSYTQRRIIWNKDGNGTAIILVGYCPQTLPHYLGMTMELMETFPDVNLQTVGFHHVTASRSIKGFTVLIAPVPGPSRKIEGWDEWDSIDFNY